MIQLTPPRKPCSSNHPPQIIPQYIFTLDTIYQYLTNLLLMMILTNVLSLLMMKKQNYMVIVSHLMQN